MKLFGFWNFWVLGFGDFGLWALGFGFWEK